MVISDRTNPEIQCISEWWSCRNRRQGSGAPLTAPGFWFCCRKGCCWPRCCRSLETWVCGVPRRLCIWRGWRGWGGKGWPRAGCTSRGYAPRRRKGETRRGGAAWRGASSAWSTEPAVCSTHICQTWKHTNCIKYLRKTHFVNHLKHWVKIIK